MIHGWQRHEGVRIIDTGEPIGDVPEGFRSSEDVLTAGVPLCLSRATPGPCQCGALTLQVIVPHA